MLKSRALPTPDEILIRLINDPSFGIDQTTRRRIIDHIANAGFSSECHPVHEWEATFANVLPRSHPTDPSVPLTRDCVLTSAEWHVVKHVATGEWRLDTTTSEYLADLRTAVEASSAVLHVGKLHPPKGRIADRTGTTTEMTTISGHLVKANAKSGSHLLVAYDPGRRCLLTVHRVNAARLPMSFMNWANHRVI